jgi:hypothetical protein
MGCRILALIPGLDVLAAVVDRMVNDSFHVDGGPVRRQMVCEVRNKGKIICRPSLQVQDIKRNAKPCTHVRQADSGLEEGRRHQESVSSDESRLCEDPDNFWVRVRRATWNEAATNAHQTSVRLV